MRRGTGLGGMAVASVETGQRDFPLGGKPRPAFTLNVGPSEPTERSMHDTDGYNKVAPAAREMGSLEGVPS